MASAETAKLILKVNLQLHMLARVCRRGFLPSGAPLAWRLPCAGAGRCLGAAGSGKSGVQPSGWPHSPPAAHPRPPRHVPQYFGKATAAAAAPAAQAATAVISKTASVPAVAVRAAAAAAPATPTYAGHALSAAAGAKAGGFNASRMLPLAARQAMH